MGSVGAAAGKGTISTAGVSGSAPSAPPADSGCAQDVDDATTGAGANQLAFSGDWSTSAGAGKYESSDHYSASSGASVSFTFNATSVAIYGARAPHHGIAAVSIDAAAAVDVDSYAAERADNVVLFQASGLSAGPHTVRLSVTGRKNPASSGVTCSIDRIAIAGGTCQVAPPEEPSEPTSQPEVPAPTGDPPVAGSGAAQPSATSVLSRRGRQLYYHGKPYQSVGVNAFGMAGCETGKPYGDEQMDAFFGSLRPLGLTRAWAFQAQGIAGVERMVHWAEVHDQLLILSFTDGRGYCGEADGRAGGEGSGKTENWYKTGYKQKYIPWLETVVTRFKDSKAIGMWELINEPGEATDTVMRAFFDDAAAHVKAIDKVHLVLSGSQAEYVHGTSDYAYVHGGPNIDVASLHEYDYDYNNGHTIVSPHLKPTLDAMRTLDKPLIVSEVGIDGSRGGNCTSLDTRRDAFQKKFDAYLAQDGVVGVLIWSWVPVERSGCAYEMSPNDPTMTLLKNY